MLSVIVAVALGQVLRSPVPNPAGPIFSQPSSMNRYAFFEFAPANGRGMGAACACANPTGAKGEALTFTRASSATCSKQGLATTGIANGDLVSCGNNLARVESSGGVLGLRVESARTNSLLRSQEIDNAAWTKFGAGVAAPTVTADFAVAPDGTTTADRVQFAACPLTTNTSGLEQVISVPTSPSSMAVYLKANSGTPSVSLCTYGSTGGSRACTQVALNTSTWTRAVYENQTHTGNLSIEIGCENRTAVFTGGGASNTGAADVLVWGVQAENNATYVTSYIPTTSAAATRSAETATFALSISQQTQCQAATVTLGSGASNDRIWTMTRQLAGSGDYLLGYTQAQGRADAVGTVSVSATGGGTFFSGTNRAVVRWTGSSLQFFRNGVQTAINNTASTLGAATILGVGAGPAGTSHLDGIVSQVQVDPDPTRCTP